MNKELIERLNDLKEKATNIVDVAKKEVRAVTDEEKTEFDNLTKEIEAIENTIAMEEKASKFEKKVVKENLTEEEKDIKNFANIIRNFRNENNLSMKDNGVIIPKTIAQKIIDKVTEISPLFASATKYNSKGTLVIPKVDSETDDVTAAYADEFAELTEHSNKFASVELKGFLIGALTKSISLLLNNSDIDLVNFVINRMAEKFRLFYEGEMINGTSSKIKGIAGSYDKENMKVELASKDAITSDELIDIQELVPDAYQANAYWIMDRSTRKAIRKLKDTDGNYILNRAFNEKWDYELLGKPVYASEKVAKLGENSKLVIAYGDFSGLAVKNTEELEISVLYEKFATQHAIGVCGYSELDAAIENTQKIAVAETPAE